MLNNSRVHHFAVRSLGAASLILLALSAYYFLPSPSTNLLDEAFWLMIAGAVTFWAALYLKYPTADPAAGWIGRIFNKVYALLQPQSATPADMPMKPARTRFIPLALGAVALLILIEINGKLLGITALKAVSMHVQFGLLVAGIVLTVWGLSGAGFPFRRTTPPVDLDDTQPTSASSDESHSHTHRFLSLSSRKSVLIILVLITLLALIVRMWGLGTAVHRFVDEIHFSSAVMTLLPGDSTIKILSPFNTITAFPWLFPYLQAWGVGLLGRNLEGLRILSVILGTLGVPALYLLARTLFDVKTALLAAFLLATFPPHIQFSRIALNNIADPLFGTLTLAFLLRGLKGNRRLDFALAGVSLGLTQYFYEGGRLLFPALICLTLGALVIAWPGYIRRRWRGLLMVILAAVMIGLPIYTTLIGLDEPLDWRFQTVGIGGSYWLRVQELGKPQTLEQHLLVPLLVYVYYPETALYYGGEQAMILPYLVPFFMLGILATLFYWRSPGIIVVVWVLVTSMGNMLMTEAAVYARYVVAFPAIAMLIAVGLRTIVWLVGPGNSRLRAGLVVILVAALAVGQVQYYFGPHLERYNQQLRQTYDNEDAIFRSAAFPWGTQVHIVTSDSPGQTYLSGLMNFLTDGVQVFVVEPGVLGTTYLEALPRGVDHAFFIEQNDPVTLHLLEQYFKLEGPYTSPYDVPPNRQLWLYYSRYGGAPAG